MFEQSLIQTAPGAQRHSALAASFVGQIVVVVGVLALPLFFTYQLPAEIWREITTLTVPPPPPPPPPTVTPRVTPVRPIEPSRFEQVLTAPRTIPDRIVTDDTTLTLSEPLAAPAAIGVPGGQLGGLPDGVLGIGGLSDAIAQPRPIRVGGNVQAARMLHRVRPVYPPDAIEARITGEVVLEAVIAPDGSIRQVRLLRGHPALASAAESAVRQWRYKPTLLNGHAMAVITNITVTFKLGELSKKEAKKLAKKVREALETPAVP